VGVCLAMRRAVRFTSGECDRGGHLYLRILADS
jgi:hypothetical protein